MITCNACRQEYDEKDLPYVRWQSHGMECKDYFCPRCEIIIHNTDPRDEPLYEMKEGEEFPTLDVILKYKWLTQEARQLLFWVRHPYKYRKRLVHVKGYDE